MSVQNRNPVEPDTPLILTEQQVRSVIERISRGIEELKGSYQHLAGFHSRDVISAASLIEYRQNIEYKSNPGLQRRDTKKISGPEMKKHLVPDEIPVYSDRYGIDIRIELTSYEDCRRSTRIWIPDVWIGDQAVEISIRGSDKKAIDEIQESIMKILNMIKAELEDSYV